MSKIPNLFNQSPLVISQGRHTQGWGTMSSSVAIDFAYIGDLICPFDGCEVILYNNSDQGQQSYFGLKLPDGSLIICVHCYPVRTGKFNKGEVVAKCRWHHYHLSMIVNGQLDCIMSYLDRSIPTMTQASLYGGNSNHPDGWFSSYPDKYLNIGNVPVINNQTHCTVLNGWGLSNVAEASGLPINEQTYQEIYNLNQGWRGSWDWQSLNARMGAGDVLRVRPDPVQVQDIKPVQPQPEQQTMPTINQPTTNQPVEEKINLELQLKLDEANKQIDELRSQIVARQKADQLEKDLDLEFAKKESFNFLQAFKGAEKVAGISASIIVFCGYLLANLSQLQGVLPPDTIMTISGKIAVIIVIAKTFLSTFKK